VGRRSSFSIDICGPAERTDLFTYQCGRVTRSSACRRRVCSVFGARTASRWTFATRPNA